MGDSTLLAVTVATRTEGKSPQAVAEARVKAALKAGYDRPRVRHAAWWAQFWEHSSVNVPEPEILRQYYLVRYFSGAASRRGAPPMPLQGVWSADAGSLPPWKGDYHNDLNTQMTYLAQRADTDAVVLSGSQDNGTERFLGAPAWAEQVSARGDGGGVAVDPNNPRIVRLFSQSVEIPVTGTLLLLNNTDKPGIVGHLGTLLARHKVNTASMSLSRDTVGGLALKALSP